MAVVETGNRHAHARARKSVPCECGADRAEGDKTIGARQIYQAIRSQWGQAAGPKHAGSISRIFACGGLERARRYSVASPVLRPRSACRFVGANVLAQLACRAGQRPFSPLLPE